MSEKPKAYSIFAVYDVPYCVWDWDIKRLNVDFIESIDHKFFEYAAHVHVGNIGGEDKHRCATALRSAFYHGLETLFALICSALQAPDCVVGWMLKYQTAQLRKMVSEISSGDLKVPVRLNLKSITWESISDSINRFSFEDSTRTSQTKHLFAHLWNLFAEYFVDEYSIWEYNSIKHGLRTSPGGFSLEFGLQDQPGTPATPEQMHLLGSSEFGHSFFTAKEIAGSKGDPNLRIVRSSVGWNPEATGYALLLIANSINNVSSFLKILNGVDPGTVQFTRPQEDEVFERAFANTPNIPSFSMGPVIEEQMIPKFTREQLKELIESQLSRGPSRTN
jgi:hypothetical protein